MPRHRREAPAIELLAEGWADWSQRRQRRFNASADDSLTSIEKDITRLYPDGEFRRLADTGHGIERDRPDAVAAAVFDLVAG